MKFDYLRDVFNVEKNYFAMSSDVNEQIFTFKILMESCAIQSGLILCYLRTQNSVVRTLTKQNIQK